MALRALLLSRYYLPPGSHGLSHFHLYRINPDGTGKMQLTYGIWNDYGPIWSPNGRFIAATHTEDWSKGANASSTTLIDLSSGKSLRLKGCQGAVWSPDSRYLCLHQPTNDEIYDLKSGGETPLPSQGAVWLNDNLLIALENHRREVFLATWDRTGQEKHRVACQWPTAKKADSLVDPYFDSIDSGSHTLQPQHHGPAPFVYVQDVGNSGDRPDNDYWTADSMTGKMTEITEGQFLSWSPGNKYYCSAPEHELTGYGKELNGYQKDVYVAALVVGSTKTGKEHQIASVLVWVTGADWRMRPS